MVETCQKRVRSFLYRGSIRPKLCINVKVEFGIKVANAPGNFVQEQSQRPIISMMHAGMNIDPRRIDQNGMMANMFL